MKIEHFGEKIEVEDKECPCRPCFVNSEQRGKCANLYTTECAPWSLPEHIISSDKQMKHCVRCGKKIKKLANLLHKSVPL